MPTTRRYYFEHPGAWDREDGYQVAAEVLAHQCERRWWYNEPVVQGQPFGRLAFAFTVTGEDAWQAHKRAMGVACAIYRRLGLAARDVPVPVWETLAPHTNRGRFRVPKEVPEPAPDLGAVLEDLVERLSANH
jgi:hypothetical protein